MQCYSYFFIKDPIRVKANNIHTKQYHEEVLFTGLDGSIYFFEKSMEANGKDKFIVTLLKFNHGQDEPVTHRRIQIENSEINKFLFNHYKRYEDHEKEKE